MYEYTKKERQQALKLIIKEQQMGDQHHLLDELRERGIEATQATVSRDLQEMGMIKTRVSAGVYKYEISNKVSKDILWNKLEVLFENFVADIKATNNMILIKTSPGNANGVASFIDRIEISEIFGTIAGDDTILVIVDTIKNRKIIEKQFNDLLNKVKSKNHNI